MKKYFSTYKFQLLMIIFALSTLTLMVLYSNAIGDIQQLENKNDSLIKVNRFIKYKLENYQFKHPQTPKTM
jgi:sulfite exporter TauE/SafE